MKRNTLSRLLAVVILILTILATSSQSVNAATATAATPIIATPYNFSDPAFAATWNRVDAPVLAQPSDAGRGFTWGPPIPAASNITLEPYNGTTRKVQYFDKARMEINDPSGDSSSLFYVTTGLLVKELVTGKLQTGDNEFTQLAPSTSQIAGDPNNNGANSIAPTYASFAKVGTFNGSENWATNNTGNAITNQIDNTGNVTSFTPPEQRLLTSYDSVTHHNIADVFMNYMNQNGILWNGSSYEQDPLFFGNPTYVFGRPVTEPYWTNAIVAGVQRQVLVQLFERRVLTYTPANSDPYKVEMGNVGQHYYQWRYSQNNGATLQVAPASNALTVSPLTDYAGQPFQITGSGFAPNEEVKLWETDPQTTVNALPAIKSDANGNINYTYKSHGPLAGRWAVTFHGMTSGVQKVAYLTLVDFVNGTAMINVGPQHGDTNSVIEVHGANFFPGEPYYYHWTAPDGTDQPGHRQYVLHHGEFRFHTQVLTAKPGTWTLTVTGLWSGRQATATFTYDK